MLWLLLLFAVACSPTFSPKEQISQCRDVVAYWSAPHSNLQHSVNQGDGVLTVVVRMTIESALGEQQGSGSCAYSLAEGGTVATRPNQIVIGKTVLTTDKDITDALAMTKDYELPVHEH